MPNIQDVKNLVADLGRASLHALMPNDFEYYMVALELTDSDDNTIDYLSFPVSPKSLEIIDPEITNIKKSAGGVVAISTPTFIPKPIVLTGTFGRKLKLLLSQGLATSFSALKFSVTKGVYKKTGAGSKSMSVKVGSFDLSVKTGYGVTKVLQAICDKSTMLDDKNQPMRLYFYNPMFNESYLVKKEELKFNQETGQSNMLWQYNLRLRAIAPLEEIRDTSKKETWKLVGMGAVQKVANTVAEQLTTALKDVA